MSGPEGDPALMSIQGLSEGIRSREISPVDVVRACLDRIERLDDGLCAFITVTGEEALKDARRAEGEIARGSYLGPLHGVPIALKDVVATKGVRTTAGSRILAEWLPEEDSAVVERLRVAGAVVIGKTNLPEFGFWAEGTNALRGKAVNPWHPERATGGSSSGSAVAVSAGMCPATVGTDTGGSGRVPASFCGTVGLKPSYGRVSRFGLVPLSWSHDHVALLARTVADVALCLQAVAGYDPRDPTSARVPVPDYSEALSRDLRGLRIGVPRRYFFDDLDDEVERAVAEAIRVFEDRGAETTEVDVPAAVHAPALSYAIHIPEDLAYHTPYLKTRADEYEPDVRKGLALGQFVLATEYIQAKRGSVVLQREVDAALGKADVLVTPTVPVSAPRVGETRVRVGGDTVDVNTVVAKLTRPFNVTGHPALTVPCGFTQEGLPTGLQIVGKRFDEATVLRAAHGYESETGWKDRRPPLP